MTARIDLSGKQGSFSWGLEAWRNLLRLMQIFGWEPLGTELDPNFERSHTFNPRMVRTISPPEVERRIARAVRDWNGTYLESGHHIVSKLDASAMADALERSLDDIPNHVTEGSKSCMTPENDPDKAGYSFKEFQRRMDQWTDPDLTNLTTAPLLFLSGPQMKKRLREFIVFCRADEFVIA